MPIRRDDDFFWEGVDRGELLAQECCDCGTLRHPPSPRCRECRSADWRPRRLSGRGVIRSWIRSRHPGRTDLPARIVVLVDLEEGLRFVSNLLGDEEPRVGAPVMLVFGEVDGKHAPLFRMATSADGEPVG